MYVRARLSVRTWRHAKLLQVLCTLLRIPVQKTTSKKCILLADLGRSCNMTSEDAHFRTRAWRLCATKSNGPNESVLQGATGCGVEAGLGNFRVLRWCIWKQWQPFTVKAGLNYFGGRTPQRYHGRWGALALNSAVSWRTFRVSFCLSASWISRHLHCQIRDAVGQIAEVKAVILRRFTFLSSEARVSGHNPLKPGFWASMLGVVVGRIFMCRVLYYY